MTCTASDQCHLAGTCSPANGACSNPPAANGTSCSDGDACTQTDSCQSGLCTGANPVTCTASDQCHVAGTCNSASGTCSDPPAPDGTACTDGDACTSSDACTNGSCLGAPVPPPGEVAGLHFQPDKHTLAWTPVPTASHDVARGLASELPVGSGPSEVCVGSVSGGQASDAAIPVTGESFWYLVRARTACGAGTYGNRSNGMPRTTSICP